MSRKAAFFDPQIPIRSKFDRLRRGGFAAAVLFFLFGEKVDSGEESNA